MRIAHLYGLVTVALLTMALLAVLGPEPTSTAIEADLGPRILIRSTVPDPDPTTTTTIPVERKPDVDELGRPVVDLLATPPPTAAIAQAPGAGPAPPTTKPRAVGTPAPTSTTAPTVQGGPNGEYEAQFAAKINGLRSGSGLAGLSRDGSLDARARAWAEYMASNGLAHSNLGSLVPPWSAAAENVGMGGSVDSVFSSLAGSGGHLANMLGDFTHLGVGVWVDSAGLIWTAHIFTR